MGTAQPTTTTWSRITARYVHGRTLVLLFGLFWSITAVSGMLHALLFSWFGFDRASLKVLMQLHQMSFWSVGKAYYPLVMGLSLVAQAILGCVMLYNRRRRVRAALSLEDARAWHVSVALFAGVFIVVVASSGFMYRLNSTWLGDKESAKWWLDVHTGQPFSLYPIFSLVVGAAVCTLIVTAWMIGPLRKEIAAMLFPRPASSTN